MQRAALTKQLYGAPTQFAAANKKFAVGKNPLELENELNMIQPQNAQQSVFVPTRWLARALYRLGDRIF